MSKNVLVVGSINVDYVINTDRLPKLGETITGHDFAMNFGGKGANQAVAIAKAGCKVKMLGAVGTEGQTKTKPASADATKAVNTITGEELVLFFDRNVETLKGIIACAEKSAGARS